MKALFFLFLLIPMVLADTTFFDNPEDTFLMSDLVSEPISPGDGGTSHETTTTQPTIDTVPQIEDRGFWYNNAIYIVGLILAVGLLIFLYPQKTEDAIRRIKRFFAFRD